MSVEMQSSRIEGEKAPSKFDKISFSAETRKEEKVVFTSTGNSLKKQNAKTELTRQINEEFGKFKTGDEEGRWKVMELLHPLINDYTRKKVSPHGSTDHNDVTQEILLAVDKSLPTYEGDDKSFLAFVYQVAAHKVVDDHRNYRQWREQSTDNISEGAELFGVNPDKRSIAEIVTQKTEVEHIKKVAEENLSKKERTILKMRLIEGMKAKEVGQVLNMTANHVRVKHHRALTKLRKELEEEKNSPTPRQKGKPQTSLTPETTKERANSVFLLKEKGCTYREIAEKLDTTVGAVGNLLRFARIEQARQRAIESSLEEKIEK